ncbi:MAG TPA: hypothetical protein VIK86_04820 [Candidatus Paceibacterota bacterium]
MAENRFTYKSYENLISHILDCGYNIANYHNYAEIDRPCIIRHDVDFDINKSLQFAKLESKISNNLHSTYFFLISGEFYNLMTKSSLEIVDRILSLGHEIGLHFDETKYPVCGNVPLYTEYVEEELYILGRALKTTISTVSMHRPSKFTLESDLKFHDAVNSSAKEFICDFKYLSDSRMRWREDVFSIIKSNQFDKLHILTHAFWYSDKDENTREKILGFVNHANRERYMNFTNNFRDLDEFVSAEDIR